MALVCVANDVAGVVAVRDAESTWLVLDVDAPPAIYTADLSTADANTYSVLELVSVMLACPLDPATIMLLPPIAVAKAWVHIRYPVLTSVFLSEK